MANKEKKRSASRLKKSENFPKEKGEKKHGGGDSASSDGFLFLRGNFPKEKISAFYAYLFNIFIFSALSYILADRIYIVVPFIAASLATFILPKSKIWTLFVIFISVLGTILFSQPPPLFHSQNLPAMVINNIIADRQTQNMAYSPPLILGLLGSFLGWGVASIIREHKKWITIFTWIIFVLFCVNFIVITLDINPGAVFRSTIEPKAGQYNNFNSVNIKTFYLMKSGSGFYRAYSAAYSQRAESMGVVPSRLWQWKMPTLFYLWKMMLPSDGFYIIYLYILLCLGIFFFVFDIASFYLKKPLNLVPLFLMAYLLIFGGAAFWFAFPEFWGAGFLMMALWGFFRKNFIAAAAGLIFAPAVSILFVPVVFGILLLGFFEKEKIYRIIPAVSLICFAILFSIHFFILSRWNLSSLHGLGEWFAGGFANVEKTFKFGSVFLSYGKIVLTVAFIMSLLSIVNLWREYGGKVLVLASFLPLVLFLVLGRNENLDYWGIVYLPFMLTASCLGHNFKEGEESDESGKKIEVSEISGEVRDVENLA